jgi:hypothetical protein
MTPNTQTQIPLDLVNAELAKLNAPKDQETKKTEEVITDDVIISDVFAQPKAEEKPITAADLRSMADKLFKEAQALRKKADELDPPKKKAVKAKAEEA